MKASHEEQLDQLCINTIRMLAVDMVETARSGHPGMPLGAAPMAYLLWTRWLQHNPTNPNWFNRDRFILSAGHGSALLYALLHLCGYNLPLDELRRFRQWGSKTPGHPEYGETPGVEMTTGPLGQGFATGVGMAMAERYLASQFNQDDLAIIDHHTYAIVSDGDLMEGVAAESASLAGHLRLGKLIYFYDKNDISIEGSTDLAFTERVDDRFRSYDWHVEVVEDGNNLAAMDKAIVAAQSEARPSLIIIKTHIGYGSPKQDHASSHGEMLGKEALRATRAFFDWPPDGAFHLPAEAVNAMRQCVTRGQQQEAAWQQQLQQYQQKYPQQAKALLAWMQGELPEGWHDAIPRFAAVEEAGAVKMATRSASGKVLNAIAGGLPQLIGGSADLAPSTKTLINEGGDFSAELNSGRNLHFGVREHAMGAAVNGMALHGGIIPYGATFFIFSDYMRPAVRLAALMNLHSIFVFTHDSIAVGEDGPTHQPIEQLASLRAMPGLTVIRPADANETAAAWRLAIERKRPVALVLTRQNLTVLDAERFDISGGVTKGAYVLADSSAKPEILLLASGSEVELILKVWQRLQDEGVAARAVSMPCWEIFAEQPQAYRDEVLPVDVKTRLAVEAAAPLGWHHWVGDAGDVLGINRFGASAPGGENMRHFGFDEQKIFQRALDLCRRQTR